MMLLSALAHIDADPSAALTHARLFLGPDSQVAPRVMAETAQTFVRDLVPPLLKGGWLPSDLAEIARRRLTSEHIPALAALLAAEADRHPPELVVAAWRHDLTGLGSPTAADPHTPAGLAVVLGLGAALHVLPVIPTLIPPPGAAAAEASTAAQGIDPKVLARVRSLLAKAESTEFPDEAEALSAKAQQLISRYALDRLTVEHIPSDHQLTTSRLWIDPPYLMAKAMLIDAVASANRCRTVISESIGFSTIVGEAADVEAVELLSTSLLVQASGAMLRHGSQTDRWGRSRTRSFRQSFLVSYATRIGERLRAATETAASESGRAGELVPVLRRHAERIDAAVQEIFPELVSRQTSVTNHLGWAAGRAAADLAILDTRGQVTPEAG